MSELTIKDAMGNDIDIQLPSESELQAKEDLALVEFIHSLTPEPLYSWIYLRPISQGKTRGGLIVPDSVQDELAEVRLGEVISVGKGEVNLDGRRIPNDVEVGDVVLYNPGADNPVPWGRGVIAMINRNAMVGRVKASDLKRHRQPRETTYEAAPCRPPAIKCGQGKCRGQATLDHRQSLENGPQYSCICGWKTPAEPMFGTHTWVEVPGDPGSESCGRCGGVRARVRA